MSENWENFASSRRLESSAENKKAQSVLTLWDASNERIARESRWAAANGVVIDNLARGANTARAQAGIYALLIAASLRQGTVGANGAFWSARRRYAEESRYARAHRLPVVLPAEAVGPAGRRRAGIRRHGIYRSTRSELLLLLFSSLEDATRANTRYQNNDDGRLTMISSVELCKRL